MPKLKKKCKTKSLKRLTHDLDKVFSEYIRQRAADQRGYTRCVCCGRRYHWKEIQAGHYVKRSARSLRWSVKNVFPCCIGCNVFQNGNYPAFTKYLLDNYGQDWLQALIKEGNKIKKWNTFEIEKTIEFYKNEIEKL